MSPEFRTDSTLVDVSWLKQQLSSGYSSDDSWLVVETSWRDEEAYLDGHIPGAVLLDTETIEADTGIEPRNWWKLVPDDKLGHALSRTGIHARSRVVLYGQKPVAPARLFWAMLYAGVQDVRILDGGLAAWTAAGEPLKKGKEPPREATEFGGKIPGRPEFRIETLRLQASLKKSDFVLADVRSLAEYEGASTGYDHIDVAGRIPSAVWARGGPLPQMPLEYFDAGSGLLRQLRDVAAMWEEQGITSDKQVAFYCGTGWRASLAFLYAYLMGWPRISVVDSGWKEWSMAPGWEDRDMSGAAWRSASPRGKNRG